MIRKVFKYILLFCIPAILIGSYFFVGLIGSVDCNKTILFNASESLNSSSDRMLVKIDSKKEAIGRWSDTDVYNYDYYNERFSIAFRISREKFVLKNDNNDSVICSLSDIKKSTVPNNETQNISALKLNTFNMESFQDNSIILPESVMYLLSLNSGDSISLILDNSLSIDFIVMDYYRPGDSSDSITTNRYLNSTYNEIGENLVFVSPSLFDYCSSGIFDAFITFGKNSKMLESCYRELIPILQSNSANFSFPECSLNNFVVNNQTPQAFAEYVYRNFYDTSKPNFIFLKTLILLSTSLIALLLISKNINSFLNIFKKYKRFKSLAIFIYATIIISIGVLFVLFGRYYLFAYISNGSTVFVSPFLSLRLLTGSTIAYIFTFILLLCVRNFFMKTVELYKKQSKHIDDIINVDLLTHQEKTPNLELVDNYSVTINSPKKVLFFGSFLSPCQSAGACRTLYFCKLFKEAGYTSFLSSFMVDSKIGDVYKYEDGIFFMPYANPPKSKKDKFHLFINPTKNIKDILNRFSDSKPEIIVIYSVMPVPAVLFLKNYCKKNNIKIIFDVVESQVLSQQSFGSFFTYYIQQRLINTTIIDKKCDVIAISSFLYEYYGKKNINSILIPFVSDTKSVIDCSNINNSFKKDKNKTYILYAGNPRNKRDLLAPIFDAIYKLDERFKEQIVFIIAGVTPEQLLKTEGVSKEVLLATTNNIVVLGKVDHYLVDLLYSFCDYTILVKPDGKRFSKAGFPTKVSESIAHGVPPIVNMSSDLELYLDNSNSIIIRGDNSNSIKSALIEALECSSKERLMMRQKSRQLSLNKLDIYTYLQPINEFLNK